MGENWRNWGTETCFFQAGTGAYGYVCSALSAREAHVPPDLAGKRRDSNRVLRSWDFRHTSCRRHALPGCSLGLAGERDQEETYYDLIAHFHSQEAFQEREAILAGLGLKLKRELPLLLAAVVEPGPESPLALEEWSSYQDKNLYLEPNWIVEAAAYELAFDTPWYLDWLRLPAAQEITRGSQDIRIAVLDSGLEENRLPAAVKVLPGYNFVGKSFDTCRRFPATGPMWPGRFRSDAGGSAAACEGPWCQREGICGSCQRRHALRRGAP